MKWLILATSMIFLVNLLYLLFFQMFVVVAEDQKITVYTYKRGWLAAKFTELTFIVEGFDTKMEKFK